MRQCWLDEISDVQSGASLPILTDEAGEGCLDPVWVLMNACLARRISLIREKLQVIVVLLFAGVIQSLESANIQVVGIAREVEVISRGRRVALKLVCLVGWTLQNWVNDMRIDGLTVRSGKTLRLTEKAERGDAAVRSTDGEAHEIATGDSRVDSQDSSKVEAHSKHFHHGADELINGPDAVVWQISMVCHRIKPRTRASLIVFARGFPGMFASGVDVLGRGIERRSRERQYSSPRITSSPLGVPLRKLLEDI